MNYLSFHKTSRKIGKNQTPRDYHDFYVSGQSLREILDIADDDLITLFAWGDTKILDQHILNVFRLREKSSLTTGRVMFYVCPECGDIDCGAITAVIRDLGDRISWSSFGYETGYGGLKESFDHIEAIEFERKSYFNSFLKVGI